MAVIKIGNKIFSGENIKIVKNQVYINGELVSNLKEEIDYPNITINVEGDLQSLDLPMGDVNITGNVLGDVKCGQGDIDISGYVNSTVKNNQGNIDIKGNVNGDVKNEMGNINCGDVSGNVRTEMGNIKYVKN